MAQRGRRRWLAWAIVALLAVPVFGQGRRDDRWVATWATALVARPAGGAAAPGVSRGLAPPVAPAPSAAGRQGGPGAPVTLSNQTLRQIVRVSLGGSRVRVVLSNVFGTAPVEIGGAQIALREKEAAVAPASIRPLTFSGSPSAAILPGAVLLSDPVDLAVPPLSDLAVDLFLPGDLGAGPSPVTTHNGASQTNYVSVSGNHAGRPAFEVSGRTTAWFLLARVEVLAPTGAGAVVAFGDSITDGARSTLDANSRWPDYLARRLAARRGGPAMAVLNAGISGNRVLGDGAGVSALARFDRDVLMQTGVTHVVILEGINDIGLARANPSPGAADLIAGHRQLIERARARGLRVIGATLTPFDGAGYFTPEGEAKRQALNQWIRTSGAYDAVIDFDAVTRDPAAPSRFLPAYDSGDRLHPGDAGYKAMGEAVDLRLFDAAAAR
jgi:lysophospholipase L1-like esterase